MICINHIRNRSSEILFFWPFLLLLLTVQPSKAVLSLDPPTNYLNSFLKTLLDFFLNFIKARKTRRQCITYQIGDAIKCLIEPLQIKYHVITETNSHLPSTKI